jgi:hypothetical protein
MRKSLIWSATGLAMCLSSGQTSNVFASETVNRAQQCATLQQQVRNALPNKIGDGELPQSIRQFRSKADHYCLLNKQAQGIRLYAKVLRYLNLRPVTDPQSVRPKH